MSTEPASPSYKPISARPPLRKFGPIRMSANCISGDDVIPASWSFVEICVATICACLPAIRAILCHWFPSVFDVNSTAPSTHPSRPSTNPTSASTPQPPPSRHSEKLGSAYNRRVIADPDADFLSTLDDDHQTIREEPETPIVKVWIKRWDTQERSPRNSSRSSMFALEGPRLSDEENFSTTRTVGIGITLDDLKSSSREDLSPRADTPMVGRRIGSLPYKRLGSLDLARKGGGQGFGTRSSSLPQG